MTTTTKTTKTTTTKPTTSKTAAFLTRAIEFSGLGRRAGWRSSP